ncbi:putative transporter SVOPL isoform X2 [Lineus longissimus]|uniref:putative transporter SVOPL isoform X2 n=1 Tax=Lineus longissimus TaxID=88925 RepID=UPI00315C5CBF
MFNNFKRFTSSYNSFDDSTSQSGDEANGTPMKRRTGKDGGSDNEDDVNYYTVDNAVEKIGFGSFQMRIMAVVGIFSAADALEMLLLSVLSPILQCEWRLAGWQVALITTVVFTGMFIMAPVWGSWCDKYGRWPILFLSSIWIFYSGIITAFAPSYGWVLFLRSQVGVGIVGGNFAFTFFTEYLPFKWRAKVLTIYQVYWALGSVFEVLLASVVVPSLGWRWLVALSSMPLIIACFLICFCIPESARYLVAAGRKREAVQVLEQAARLNKTTLPEGQLIEEKQHGRGSIKDLFSKDYWLTTLLLVVIWFASAFSYYGMVLGSSEIEKFQPGHCRTPPSPNKIIGNHTISKYSCHWNCHPLTHDDYMTMIISAMGEFLAIPVNFFLLDLIGRKKSMALNCLGAGIGFLLLQICTTRGILTGISLGIRAFCTGMFLSVYIYTTEVYPTTVRSLGLGFNSAMARIGAMVTPFVSQVLLSQFPTGTVYVYGGVCSVCAVVSLLLPIETKGREMPQTVHR